LGALRGGGRPVRDDLVQVPARPRRPGAPWASRRFRRRQGRARSGSAPIEPRLEVSLRGPLGLESLAGGWRAPICFVGALGCTLNVQRVRPACSLRAPPRSWTLSSHLLAKITGRARLGGRRA